MYYNNQNYVYLTPTQQNTIIRQNKIREMKKAISGLGFLLLSAEILFNVIYLIFSVFIGVTNVFSSPFYIENYSVITELLHGTIIFVSFFIIGLMYCIFSGTKLSSVITFKKVKPKKITAYVFFGLGIAYLGNVVATLLSNNLSLLGIPVTSNDSETNYNTISFIVTTFVISVTPAFAEEFLFRGIILGKLRKYGDSFAVLTSAFLFGLMHANIPQIPFAFVGGIFFGFITVKTNSLLPAMITHFANNLLSCLEDIIYSYGNEYIINFVSVLLFAIILILGIISFIYLIKTDDKLFKFDKSKNYYDNVSLKEKIKCFSANPGIICAVVFLLLETISFVCWS